jgi:hypothetical protein
MKWPRESIDPETTDDEATEPSLFASANAA